MNVVVVSEYRFRRDGTGRLLSSTGTRGYSFWNRYLQVFDSVTVVARVDEVPDVRGCQVEGPGVDVIQVPAYAGAAQFVLRMSRVRSVIKRAIASDAAVILRVPGALGRIADKHARVLGKPYGLELVGDPYDVFAPGAVNHPLRPIFRFLFTRATRRQAQYACGVAYVTEHTLQERYPSPSLQVAASSVELPDDAFVERGKRHRPGSRSLTLITVGSLAQPYKGVDVLINAVAQLRRERFDVRLRVVGDGKFQLALGEQARKLGVADRIHFLGRLPAGVAVREELDKADAFVLASRTEGLPRAMIEAMARGLPCIGTCVGGIPELLSSEYLVPANDSNALATAIRKLAEAPAEELDRASRRNLNVARRYHRDILNKRRILFYAHVRDVTAAWKCSHR